MRWLVNAFGKVRGSTVERIHSNYKTVCIKYVYMLGTGFIRTYVHM